jgi:hypothetical protein
MSPEEKKSIALLGARTRIVLLKEQIADIEAEYGLVPTPDQRDATTTRDAIAMTLGGRRRQGNRRRRTAAERRRQSEAMTASWARRKRKEKKP